MALGSLVYFVVWLLVFGLVISLVWWAGTAIVGLLPGPLGPIAHVVMVVLIALVCIGALVGLLNGAWTGVSFGPRSVPVR